MPASRTENLFIRIAIGSALVFGLGFAALVTDGMPSLDEAQAQLTKAPARATSQTPSAPSPR